MALDLGDLRATCRAVSIVLASAAAGAALFTFARSFIAHAAPATDPSRQEFARPSGVPFPPENPASPEKIALGQSLFFDKRLSANGQVACASCHIPALAFTDGVARGKGVANVPLSRNTPALWNQAWGESFFWDGRAKSLEGQARTPIEHPLEMAMKLTDAVAKLRGDAAIAGAFSKAFGSNDALNEKNIFNALATYERTLVSPKTRFDRWIEGDDSALKPIEINGLNIFTGKAGCTNCHSTWRFTDDAFHDIGLPDHGDKGRGPIAGLAAAGNAFKTPSLRELVWTAPYMHDGSVATLDEVLAHYIDGVQPRPTLSKDLPPALALNAEERRELVAFLQTLSSDDPPTPDNRQPVVQTSSADAGAPMVATTRISQKNKQFTPQSVSLALGQALTIVNDDKRTHSVRVDDPKFKFASDAQEPGDSVVLTFPEAGIYGVICSIHPKMKLSVTVTAGR